MGLLTYTQTLIANSPENINTVQAMFDQVRGVLNGNIDSANLADFGVQSNDIADSAITTAKILDGTIAGGDLAQATKDLFAQLAVPGRRLGVGRFATGGFGGTTRCDVTFAHGLPWTPLYVVGSCDRCDPGDGNLQAPSFGYGGSDATNIAATLRSASALAVGTVVTWLALG